ncbi:hypothetical protein [Hymenobacter glacieicola]|uniref:Uncharacterized protein n=1 Tax=Hymenobacter glacieicola TaxID=1562124 RepID=A0ABQ1WLE6_9BACT|nr:hypothetical protein [Hymenobacter glacieicola]GGG32706.1 hypothetical protein GCM10011378_06400 [Hymenobacter glacieicola]
MLLLGVLLLGYAFKPWPEYSTLLEPGAHSAGSTYALRTSSPCYQSLTTYVSADGSYFEMDSPVKRVCAGVLGLFSLLLGWVVCVYAYQARFAPDYGQWIREDRPEAPIFAVEEYQLRLVRPYPYLGSALAHRTRIAADELTEVHPLGRWAVVDDREVIYLKYNQWAQLVKLAQAHRIPLVDRTWPWPLLTAPFATDYDSENEESYREQLLEMGISTADIRAVRWRIYLGLLFQPQEWSFLTGDERPPYHHTEVLDLTGCTLWPRKRWYYRTMDLMLKRKPKFDLE